VKILLLTPRFPYPPDRGDRVHIYSLLRALSARHQVTLLSFADGEEPAESRERVSRYCERVVTVRLSRARSWLQAWLGLFSSVPSQVAFYWSGRMESEVRRAVAHGGFDVILVHAIRVAPPVLDLAHPLKILYQVDSVGRELGLSVPFVPWWKRPGVLWERWRVDRYLPGCSRRFAQTWAVSPVDGQDLVRLGCPRVEVVPLGVDEGLLRLERRPAAEPRVMFLGNLSVPHNIDAAEFAAVEIWPAVRSRWPQARLILAGADPAAAVRRLADIAGVEVTGRVPDLTDLWRSAHVMLAPIRYSAGAQFKVIEAMAAGVPVVTTPPVAAAIGAVDPDQVLVAATADGLSAAVARTLEDAEAAARRAARAREHVLAAFTWDAQVRRMEELIGRCGGATT
jgi:hypothetical protein